VVGDAARDEQVDQSVHHVVGFQAVAHAQGKALPRVFVDDGEEADLRAIQKAREDETVPEARRA